MDENKKAEKYLQSQALKNQLNELNEKKSQIVQLIIQITQTMDVLEKIDQMKDNIMFSIGSNVFLDGSVKNTNKIIVNIGSNIFASKSLENAKVIMRERIEAMSNGYNQITAAIDNIRGHIITIDKELSGG